jgi:hypothetical protein
MIENDIYRCGTCKFFTGLGDWDLCCSNPPARKVGCFGFLCYETTPACENYRNKDDETIRNFVEPVNYEVLPFMDYLGDLGLSGSDNKTK